jgi:DNA adenine methylase
MSFLQWAGGKAKSMQYITPYIPKKIHNYYEPFLGGGSVLLHILSKADAGEISLTGRVVAADINMPIVLCYQAVKEDPEGVVAALERLCAAYDACPTSDTCKKHYCVCGCQECMYYAARALFNIYKNAPIIPEIETAATFLFLNATCYRGLYRESKAGAFNTCYWTSRPLFPKSDRILEAGRLFQKYDVTFECRTYSDFWLTYLDTKQLSMHDLVYIDPPFIKTPVPAKRSKHDKEGTVDAFEQSDAKWLYEWVQAQRKENGAPNVLWSTYSGASPTEALNDSMIQHTAFTAHRSMMYKGTTKVVEYIVSNIPEDEK